MLIFRARSLTSALLSFFHPTQHPCGTGEYAEPEDTNDLDFSDCAKSFDVIMGNINYRTATHVVPCPTDVCVSECASLGEATTGTFQCFNASTLMSANESLANNRGLAMGCPGSHNMSNMAGYMAGHDMGDCEASHVHFAHHEDHDDSAAYAVSSVVAVVSTFALAFALA